MLYVQQSLGPREEIVFGARFHWMYTVQAVMWVMLFLAFAIFIGSAAIWWQISGDIRTNFAGLPPHLFDEAWGEMVHAHGGYLKVLWKMPVALRVAILGSFVLGLGFFGNMMVIRATTEIAVTTERVIYKRGLIARDVGEINIDRIEGVAVHQGFLGRLFGYGQILIRGMGVGEVLLPIIEAPIEFRRAIQEAQSIQGKSGNLRSSDDF